MSEEVDDGIKREPAEKNPWYWLAQESISLDKTNLKPNGWHWLILLDHIIEADIPKIQELLPDEHPLKLVSLPIDSNKQELESIIDNFNRILGNPGNIQNFYFANLIFSEEANFENFIFPLPVVFKNTYFKKIAKFTSAFFLQAEFVGAHFSDKALFMQIIVPIKIDFNKAIFFNIACFNEAKFNGLTQFIGTKFSSVVFFNDATFKKTTHFIDTQFKTHVPNFYNTTLNADIVWEWDVNFWPQTKKHKNDKTDIHHKGKVSDNRNAYEDLASHMKELDKYHDRHFFFRQEMRCRQWLTKNPFAKLFYWFYEKISDYGYAIERAFGCWLGHIVFWALIIAFIAVCNGLQFNESLPCAISVSFANANPYAFFGFDSSSLMGCYAKFEHLAPISFAIIKAIQTTLGIVLLFILILTLRTRFRLK